MAIGGAVFDVGEFVHLHVGGPHIVRTATRSPPWAYHRRLADQSRANGVTAGSDPDPPIPADRGIPGHGGPLDLPA